ncbi:TonB-dependent receptor [Phenylobacterium sp. LjRoot225]|uniref:TonB-dependent receptor n=1 Tax=Phenylobacterium sp. LjRoot225 TaxID=3342285 RepID=UPI003ECFB704
MRDSYIKALLVGTAISCCGLSAPAYAQNAAPNDPNLIIVTARRLQERLQDVPISIAVINQDQINNRNIVNAADLATFTPSLSSANMFGSENSSYVIRGFVQDIGTAPSVGVYFADVVAPRGASNGITSGDGAGPGSFFDLQNVQVLKGPQGTLFGRNTTGGAVLLVPQKPARDFEAYAEGSIGNYDMRRLQGVVNLPLNESLRVRLGVDRQKRDGFIRNTSGVGPRDFADIDYTALRASVVLDVTPDLETYTIASYTHSNTHGTFQKLIAADPSFGLGGFAAAQLADQAAKGEGFYDARQDVVDPRSKLKQWQIINTTTWLATDNLTVKNIISYAELTNDYKSAIFGTAFSSPPIPALGLASFRFGFANSTPIPGGHTSDESTFTEELQLQGRAMDDRLTWQAGGYFESAKPLSTVGSQSPVVISCTDSNTLQCYDILGFLGTLAAGSPQHAGAVNLTAGRTTFKNLGAYAQATYTLTEELKLTGGIRYTSDKQTNVSLQRTFIFGYPLDLATFQPIPVSSFSLCTNPAAPAATCTLTFKQKSHKPTWLIGLDYTPSSDLLVYAKWARGYRAGTIAPNVTAPYNIVKPETVDTYEAGLKASFDAPIKGTFNAAAFYNDFRNQQLQLGFDPAPGVPISPTAAPINAGKSRIYGLEIGTTLTLFEGFTLQADYTYLNTKILSIPVFTVQPGSPYVIHGAQQKGDPLALSPKNKFVVSANYALPLDEAIGKISLGADFSHTDKVVTNYIDRTFPNTIFENLGVISAYDLLNLNVTWSSVAGKPVDIGLFATNVTKEEYYTWVPGLVAGTGFETAQLGAPRMYGMRVRVRFG